MGGMMAGLMYIWKTIFFFFFAKELEEDPEGVSTIGTAVGEMHGQAAYYTEYR